MFKGKHLLTIIEAKVASENVSWKIQKTLSLIDAPDATNYYK